MIYILILLAAAVLDRTPASAQSAADSIRKAEVRVQPIAHARPLYRKDTLKIIVLGDIMMHSQQIRTALKNDSEYHFDSYFRHIEDRIREADIAIGNMEFTLGGQPYTGYPCFSAPDSFAGYLAETGFDVFLCANNHIFDKGAGGAERTIRMYESLKNSYGIMHTGLRTRTNTDAYADADADAAGADPADGNHKGGNCKAEGDATDRSGIPLFVTRKGIRVAILNFTYGTNTGTGLEFPKVNRLTDKGLLKKAFAEAQDAEFVLALPHWGNEYVLKHSDAQRRDAEIMAKEGAGVIIGSHPHVVQDVEHIHGIPVVYSLGNAVSNMSAQNTQVELMAEIRIIRESNGDLIVEEPRLTWLWCSRPGGYTDDYTVLPIEEFIGRRDEWSGKWDYDKMVSSWLHVRSATGAGKN